MTVTGQPPFFSCWELEGEAREWGAREVPWRADRDQGVGVVVGVVVGVGKDAVKVAGGGGIRSEVRCCWWLDTGQWRDRGSRARRRLYEPFEPLGSSQADELSRFQAWSDPGPPWRKRVKYRK